MSEHVYVDFRTSQIQACDIIMREAMSQLDAQRSQISCGSAAVHTTAIDAKASAKAFDDARMQDTVAIKDTSGLSSKLTADTANLDASALGDWKPAVGAPALHVDGGRVDGQPGMRLIEDLECAALDGARLMIFAVDNPTGGTSYQIGLETALFDEHGNWRNTRHQAAYENFLKQTLAAQKLALAEKKAGKPLDAQTAAAMRVAGLHARERTAVPGNVTHSVFTNVPDTAAKNDKTMRIGGDDKGK